MRSPVGAATRSLLDVLRARDIRSLELAWTIGVGTDWALLVVTLLVAYDAGGPIAVGLVSVTRMIPATLVNVLVDASAVARGERILVAANLVRAACAAILSGAIVAGQPLAVFASLAVASAAGALVRPTSLSLLPALAVSPAQLVSANTVFALGESLGTFGGPLLTSLVMAQAGTAPAAAAAALAGLAAAAIVAVVRVADAARPRSRDRARGVPLVAGIRELAARPPAAAVMTSFIAQTVVRGALTTYLALLAIEVLDLGDEGVGLLGAALGLGGIAGALVALALGGRREFAPVFLLALMAWGAPLAVVGLLPWPAGALLALAVVGLGNALLDVSGFTLLQRGTADRARAAVFSVLEVGASAGVSVGGLLGSALVTGLGIRPALVVTGIVLPLVAVAGWRLVRRLDAEGVVPEGQASLLRGIPLFAMLPLAAVEHLAAGMRPVTFEPGERLMTQGERGDTYLVIETGHVAVEIDGRPVARPGPGDGVGEIALLRAMPRTATVTALAPVRGWAIDGETFVDAVCGHDLSAAAARAVVEVRLRPDQPADA